jgi:hypothetical protein
LAIQTAAAAVSLSNTRSTPGDHRVCCDILEKA